MLSAVSDDDEAENTYYTYDSAGNVIRQQSGDTFTWDKVRQLQSVKDGSLQVSYAYDDAGIRTSKTVNGVTTHYNTKDGVILAQSDGNNTLYFQYDTSGVPFAFVWNDTQYFYVTNQMGDVMGITDDSGNLLVQYHYDAWGKLLSTTLTDANNATQKQLAQLNPLLYRGYYYDFETGYYYLQSRYYDPNLCRFINSDRLEMEKALKSVSPNDNAYCYCYNNPVNYTDITGYLALEGALAGGALAGLALAAADVIAVILVVILGIATLGIGFLLLDSVINSISTERTLSDVRTQQRKNNKREYQFCYIYKIGKMVKIGSKLTFVQTLVALGAVNPSTSISRRYVINKNKLSNTANTVYNKNKKVWGVYADSQSAAKALSVVLGSQEVPKVAGIGNYGHYHDGKHLIHIWFGKKIYF